MVYFVLGLAMPSGNGAKMHDLKMNYLNVLSSKEEIKGCRCPEFRRPSIADKSPVLI